MQALQPPFGSAVEVFEQKDLTYPALYRENLKLRQLRVLKDDAVSLQEWVGSDLHVGRLNTIHRHLWYAGLPRIPRALHEQVRIGRTLVISEQADLHLVWTGSTMLLKPVPNYLLSHGFWVNVICDNAEIHQDAKGFLLSYIWLVNTSSDFDIAIDKGLLPKNVTWKQWVDLSKSVLSTSDHAGQMLTINPRYLYGELRLTRLNTIYRLCSATRTRANFSRGYEYGYRHYSTFVQRNFGWLVTATVYITIVLTAMQVGLATNHLSTNSDFQAASFGFTVFSIVAPLGILTAVAIALSLIYCWNWNYARNQTLDANRTWQPPFTLASRVDHVKPA